jgi:hypothetical protein
VRPASARASRDTPELTAPPRTPLLSKLNRQLKAGKTLLHLTLALCVFRPQVLRSVPIVHYENLITLRMQGNLVLVRSYVKYIFFNLSLFLEEDENPISLFSHEE